MRSKHYRAVLCAVLYGAGDKRLNRKYPARLIKRVRNDIIKLRYEWCDSAGFIIV